MHTEGWKLCANREPVCALENFRWCAEPCFACAAVLRGKCQSQSHIATDGQSISKSWCRAPSGAHDQIFITLWQLWSCFWGALSLTRGRICLLYMLLALASIVFLESESLGTRDHILLSQICDFLFSSPPTTRRVMVEVFEPASTWLSSLNINRLVK
jgi:hypothetical protein